MKKFLFVLGTTSDLSWAELSAVLGAGVVRFNDRIALGELESDAQAITLLGRLGGTVKVAKIIDELAVVADQATIIDRLTEYFVGLQEPKVHFAVSELGGEHLPRFDLIRLKDHLQDSGLKVRFSDSPRAGVGAALLLHRRQLKEIILARNATQLIIAQTLAVQNIDDWTLRDRVKPYSDHKKGMLPPKVARMMVNLALAQEVMSISDQVDDQANTSITIYDPFCGTGTVLLEAAEHHLQLLGSDLDVKAVIGTKENLAWFEETYSKKLSYQIFTQDVAKVSLGQLGSRVNYLVTEPFLGKQTPKSKELHNVFRGLEKMYWGAFRHWQEILTDQARIVIVFPRVRADNHQVFNLDSLLDKLAALGYNKLSRELFYARPGAIVEREICVFEYNKVER